MISKKSIELFSGTASARHPRDKSEYTKFDHRVEALIQNDNVEQLLDLAKDYSPRIGDMLGNYRVALLKWEENKPDLLRKLLTMTWDRLDEETRRRYVYLMLGMVYRVSKSSLYQKGSPTGDPAVNLFNFQGDEIDLDRTVEAVMENRSVSYDNIFVFDRKRRKKAAVIMIDASGSMQGSNLSIAAIAASSLAMNLNFKDEYGIVLFSEKYFVFKRIDQPKHLDDVVSGILDILPEGRTNISIGLSAGLQELRRSPVQQKMGILLTDGWQNSGQDPIRLAMRFPQLHIINLPGGNPELSKKIARSGRGHFIPLTDMLEVPKAIIACLTQS